MDVLRIVFFSDSARTVKLKVWKFYGCVLPYVTWLHCTRRYELWSRSEKPTRTKAALRCARAGIKSRFNSKTMWILMRRNSKNRRQLTSWRMYLCSSISSMLLKTSRGTHMYVLKSNTNQNGHSGLSLTYRALEATIQSTFWRISDFFQFFVCR